jgi:hypothetical protein
LAIVLSVPWVASPISFHRRPSELLDQSRQA